VLFRLNNEPTGRLSELIYDNVHGVVFALLTPAIFTASKRWPFRGTLTLRLLLVHFALAAIMWLAVGVIVQGLLSLMVHPRMDIATAAGLQKWARDIFRWTLNSFPIGVAVYGAGVGMEHAVRYFLEARRRDVEMAQLSRQLSDARFSALQAQLNPHFLFNTLNTITVLVRDGDREGATQIVEQLSDVLRRTLARNQAVEVQLEQELELVRQYLAIEQVRFSDRLQTEFHIDPAVHRAATPSFALQHLVENAIRHGIAKSPDAGRLVVNARRDGDMLVLTVSDDGEGIAAGAVAPRGHGIENTRERLHSMFGERARLTVERGAAGGTVATLRVPFREVHDAAN
jgi:two-component system, LytTR family, sensor kinase